VMFAFLNKLVMGILLVSDERALVLAASNFGFVFKTRLPDCVSIEVVCVLLGITINLHETIRLL